jgi:hypothetical protein
MVLLLVRVIGIGVETGRHAGAGGAVAKHAGSVRPKRSTVHETGASPIFLRETR